MQWIEVTPRYMSTLFLIRKRALKKAISSEEVLSVNPFMCASIPIVIRRRAWKKEVKSII
tara:strand:+ start:220 stop:399 length:180 start_codon:yes stop_codon:yes gene_type:complete